MEPHIPPQTPAQFDNQRKREYTGTHHEKDDGLLHSRHQLEGARLGRLYVHKQPNRAPRARFFQ